MGPRTDATGAFAEDLHRVLADRAPPHRRALLAGVLNAHLAEGQRAVMVGGALVEFLTSAAYTTGDVDLVGDRRAIGRLLESAGFTREGRHYVHEDLGLVVEVVGADLRESEAVVTARFEDYTFPTVSVEDAVVDRLLAAKFWRSQTDWEQAVLLVEAHGERLQRHRLKTVAALNDVSDALAELRRAIAGSGRKEG